MRWLISGGAPLSQQTKYFLTVSFGCGVFECYGATEAAGCLTTTSCWEQQAGLVGGPLACLKMKVKDLPELGYLSTHDPPTGELCIKGNSVFKGYFRNAELTQSVQDGDDWVRLGDVVKIMPNGALQIIDRVKSICKLQHGLYVAPQYLENVYAQCTVIN